MKRAVETKPTAGLARERQIIELLAQLRVELCRQWEQSVRSIPVDDEDLLPERQQIENALVAVNLALERAGTGQYGFCRGCGGRIDFERLLAHPAATTCWPCQEAAEDKRRAEVCH
jgi:RNA polymerase-binding transcription factor DksA